MQGLIAAKLVGIARRQQHGLHLCTIEQLSGWHKAAPLPALITTNMQQHDTQAGRQRKVHSSCAKQQLAAPHIPSSMPFPRDKHAATTDLYVADDLHCHIILALAVPALQHLAKGALPKLAHDFEPRRQILPNGKLVVPVFISVPAHAA